MVLPCSKLPKVALPLNTIYISYQGVPYLALTTSLDSSLSTCPFIYYALQTLTGPLIPRTGQVLSHPRAFVLASPTSQSMVPQIFIGIICSFILVYQIPSLERGSFLYSLFPPLFCFLIALTPWSHFIHQLIC